jgi:hypothetical protein
LWLSLIVVAAPPRTLASPGRDVFILGRATVEWRVS